MKLLVCDFDGTYFKDEESILINNQEVQKWRRENNLFMLSSGRSFQSLKKMCIRYNIEYDIILNMIIYHVVMVQFFMIKMIILLPTIL